MALYSGVGFCSSQSGNLIITIIIFVTVTVSSTLSTGWYNIKTNMCRKFYLIFYAFMHEN